jgi:hypothetical protein
MKPMLGSALNVLNGADLILEQWHVTRWIGMGTQLVKEYYVATVMPRLRPAK